MHSLNSCRNTHSIHFQKKNLAKSGIVLMDFSLTVKAVTLIFISGRCSASSSAKQEKSGSMYNLVKN